MGFVTEVSGLFPPPALSSDFGRMRGAELWERERGLWGEWITYSGRFADILGRYQGKYELRGKRRGDIIREF